MGEEERLIAVITPWTRLSEVVKNKFRLESLPAEKKVAVWRDDLQSEQAVTEELQKLGVTPLEIRKKRVMTNWKEVE